MRDGAAMNSGRPRPQRAVVFDFDGVIADSALAVGRCVDHALVARGRPPHPPSERAALIGPPLHDVFRTLLGADGDEATIAACVADYRDLYRTSSLEDTRAFPGIVAAVEALAAELPLGIATTKPLRFAEPLVVRLGLRPAFAAVEGPGPEAEHETKSETLGRALARLGDPERAVMIGDRGSDMRAAHDHAALAVGVAWGYGTPTELRDAGADVIVDRPDQLVAAVRALLAPPGPPRTSSRSPQGGASVAPLTASEPGAPAPERAPNRRREER